jgi:hypothetical protein
MLTLTQFEWNSVQTLAPLIIGIAGLLVTLVYERLWAKEAFLRHSLYHNTASTTVYLGGCIQGLVVRIPFISTKLGCLELTVAVR